MLLTGILISDKIIKSQYSAPTPALQIQTTSKGGVRHKLRILGLKPLTHHRMKSARKMFLVTQQEGSRRSRSLSFKYRFKNFVMPVSTVSQCRRPNERHTLDPPSLLHYHFISILLAEHDGKPSIFGRAWLCGRPSE